MCQVPPSGFLLNDRFALRQLLWRSQATPLASRGLRCMRYTQRTTILAVPSQTVLKGGVCADMASVHTSALLPRRFNE